MKGDRDSEIAMVISGGSSGVLTTMAGRPWTAGFFAFSLRLSLWQEHTGVSHTCVHHAAVHGRDASHGSRHAHGGGEATATASAEAASASRRDSRDSDHKGDDDDDDDDDGALADADMPGSLVPMETSDIVWEGAAGL
jgi:hypothetical protein